MKIVLLDAATIGSEIDFSSIEALGNFTSYELTSPSEVADRIKGADCIITNKVIINEEHMKNAPDLKLICVAATGTNNIDSNAAKSLGIVVSNVSGYSTEGVAQHAMAMILYGNQHLHYYHQYAKNEYHNSPFFSHHGRTIHYLKGQTLGIFGLGTIGLEVAKLAAAFGMKIQYHSASGKNVNQPYTHVSWETFLATSDIISIHAPLNEFTLHKFNSDAFMKMKKGAKIINTGRGGILVEDALIEAIHNETVSFAALDVFEKEPIIENHPIKTISNEKVLLTPHVAWAALESRKILVQGIALNIQRFLSKL